MPPCSVIPVLVYEDVEEAVGWLCETFGLQVRWQVGDHRAQLSLNGGTVVVTEPRTSAALPGPQSLLVRIPDVDGHFRHARERGAKILDAPRDFPYGERQYAAEDLGGHRWGFSQSIADVAPESWGGTRGPALHAPGPLPDTQLSIMLIVPDAGAAIAVIRGALAAGATLASPIEDHHHFHTGVHRQGTVRDPFGHNWSIGNKSPLRPRLDAGDVIHRPDRSDIDDEHPT